MNKKVKAGIFPALLLCEDIMELQLLENVKAADMVLIGIGEELEEKYETEQMDENLKKYFEFLEEKKKQEKLPNDDPKIRALLNPDGVLLEEYVRAYYVMNHRNEKLMKVYRKLENLLEKKNYFIVSLCKDDYILQSNLQKERIVNPCGSYSNMQCINNCTDSFINANDKIQEVIEQIDINQDNEIIFPKCEKCGSNLVFNNINATNYNEKNYMDKWNRYTKWLQGTVNRKLCILELGVSLQYPTVIRWPFEKIALINQKSSFYRINKNLYQFPEELKSKGISIAEEPMQYLTNKLLDI